MSASNTFQVRRTPINIGLIERRRLAAHAAPAEDHAGRRGRRARGAARRAPRSPCSPAGPTPRSRRRVARPHARRRADLRRHARRIRSSRTTGSRRGEPLTDVDVRERRLGRRHRRRRRRQAVRGRRPGRARHSHPRRPVHHRRRRSRAKGRVLGQSFDGFVMLPITTFESMYGRRQTTTISVKMPDAATVAAAMARAEEAMRVAHRLRPGERRQLLRRDGRRAGRLLEAAHAACCSASFRRSSRSASSSAAS